MCELIPQSLCTALTGASSEMQRLGIRTERERERWVVDDDGETEERERGREEEMVIWTGWFWPGALGSVVLVTRGPVVWVGREKESPSVINGSLQDLYEVS